MKKIVNGKIYDTETSREVGYWSNGYPRNDFNFHTETLYKNSKGVYFLYCEGGAMSPYAKSYGRDWGWGDEIIPLTETRTIEWAMKNLSADEFEAEFGKLDEASPDSLE